MDAFAEIRDWHSACQSCTRYLCDYAQRTALVQALAAYMNIRLPSQRRELHARQDDPIQARNGRLESTCLATLGDANDIFSLIPYIRRLVATGLDSPSVLHAFFGDCWRTGLKHILTSERNNFLLVAKSGNWLSVKLSYDMEHGQEIPFLVPRRQVSEMELYAAERHWSAWLAMQDWMIGTRTPDCTC